jgi:hypothetical protein
MRLSLFRDVYVDAAAQHLWRLLFEGERGATGDGEECRDFYLYVWVRHGKVMDGFQAVLDEEFVLTYRHPGEPTVGAISHQPIGRTITDTKLKSPRRRIVRILEAAECEYFPELLKVVAGIAGDRAPATEFEFSRADRVLVEKMRTGRFKRR